MSRKSLMLGLVVAAILGGLGAGATLRQRTTSVGAVRHAELVGGQGTALDIPIREGEVLVAVSWHKDAPWFVSAALDGRAELLHWDNEAGRAESWKLPVAMAESAATFMVWSGDSVWIAGNYGIAEFDAARGEWQASTTLDRPKAVGDSQPQTGTWVSGLAVQDGVALLTRNSLASVLQFTPDGLRPLRELSATPSGLIQLAGTVVALVPKNDVLSVVPVDGDPRDTKTLGLPDEFLNDSRASLSGGPDCFAWVSPKLQAAGITTGTNPSVFSSLTVSWPNPVAASSGWVVAAVPDSALLLRARCGAEPEKLSLPSEYVEHPAADPRLRGRFTEDSPGITVVAGVRAVAISDSGAVLIVDEGNRVTLMR